MHAIPSQRIQLDPTRIASISGAIAVNGLLLLLLIAPMAPPVVKHAQETFVELLPVRPKDPPKPPIPDKPIKVEITKPQPAPLPRPTHVERIESPPEQVVNDDPQPGDVQAAQPDVVRNDPPTFPPDDGKPMAGAHLEYASNPAPAYPADALRDGASGTVMLEVLVDVDGRPITVKVARSSGTRSLDQAARRQVLANWTFRPAMRNGRAVQAIGVIPVEFKLD